MLIKLTNLPKSCNRESPITHILLTVQIMLPSKLCVSNYVLFKFSDMERMLMLAEQLMSPRVDDLSCNLIKVGGYGIYFNIQSCLIFHV